MVAGAITAGCTAPQRNGPVTSQALAGADSAQRETLWLAAQDVLREHHFRLDRVDVRTGVIRTQPQTSEHFFEFWRDDVKTPYDALEASLRTVRRSVEISMVPSDGDEAIAITVQREYFCTPERQFNSSIAALRMFGNDLPRADTGEPITDRDSYWVNAGRDLAVERYLLDEILRRAGA